MAAQPARVLQHVSVPPSLVEHIGADRLRQAFAAMVRALESGEPVSKLGPVFSLSGDGRATDYRIVREDRS